MRLIRVGRWPLASDATSLRHGRGPGQRRGRASMSQVVIENPIINSPFDEPTRHFRFSDEGITNEIDNGRRTSSYFVPVAKPKKKGSSQPQFDTEQPIFAKKFATLRPTRLEHVTRFARRACATFVRSLISSSVR